MGIAAVGLVAGIARHIGVAHKKWLDFGDAAVELVWVCLLGAGCGRSLRTS